MLPRRPRGHSRRSPGAIPGFKSENGGQVIVMTSISTRSINADVPVIAIVAVVLLLTATTGGGGGGGGGY
jgi:acetyl-CoA carboxylase alpha subunit